MPQVGLKPKTPVFERVKKVHASDGAATVVGFVHFSKHNYAIKPSRKRESRHVASIGQEKNLHTILMKQCKDLF
jgi:hypothetical protein